MKGERGLTRLVTALVTPMLQRVENPGDAQKVRRNTNSKDDAINIDNVVQSQAMRICVGYIPKKKSCNNDR